jgi:hypothetical protein
MFPPEPVHVPDVVLLDLFLLFGHGVGPSGGTTKPDGLGTWSVGHDRERSMLLLRGCDPERDTEMIGLIEEVVICDLVMKGNPLDLRGGLPGVSAPSSGKAGRGP